MADTQLPARRDRCRTGTRQRRGRSPPARGSQSKSRVVRQGVCGSPAGVTRDNLHSQHGCGDRGKPDTRIASRAASVFPEPVADPSTPRSRSRGRQPGLLLNGDQHRQLAALLRKGTAPGRNERALYHEQLAATIERREREIAEMRASPPDSHGPEA